MMYTGLKRMKLAEELYLLITSQNVIPFKEKVWFEPKSNSVWTSISLMFSFEKIDFKIIRHTRIKESKTKGTIGEMKYFFGNPPQLKVARISFIISRIKNEINLRKIKSTDSTSTVKVKRCLTESCTTKPLDEFYKNPKSKDGHQSYCMVCTRIINNNYNKIAKEKRKKIIEEERIKQQEKLLGQIPINPEPIIIHTPDGEPYKRKPKESKPVKAPIKRSFYKELPSLEENPVKVHQRNQVLEFLKLKK